MKWWFAMVLGGLALVAGCSGSDPLVATLVADAELGGQVQVTHEIDGEVVTETVDTPWELTVELDGSFDVDLRVDNLDDTGRVRCAIELGFGSPDSGGEAAALCSASGFVDGGEVQINSSSEGIRFGDEEGTDQPEDDDADATTGIDVSVRLVDTDGRPVEPRQFEAFVIQVVVEGIEAEAIIEVDSEWDDGLTVRSQDVSELIRDADLDDDGVLRYAVPDVSGYTPLVAGSHRVDVEGSVSLVDGDVTVPFAERFDFDIVEAAVTTNTEALADGIVTASLPTDWEVFAQSSGVRPEVEAFGPEALAGLDLDDFEELIAIGAIDGSNDLGVWRMRRPLLLPTVEVLAENLVEFYEGPPDEVGVEAIVGGQPGLRVAGASGGSRYSADIVRFEDEVFLVQARARIGDDAGWDAVAAVRDSLVFDLGPIPPLVHAQRVSVWRGDDRSTQFSFEVPADWGQVPDSPSTIADASSGAFIRAIVIPDDELDTVIAGVLGDFGLDRAALGERTDEIDGVVYVTLQNAGAGDVRLVVVADAGSVRGALVVLDAAATPDDFLAEAIADSFEFDPAS